MDENNPNGNNETKVVNYNENAKDGQTKCPKCGATEITLNTKNGKLRCNFCRHEFEAIKLENDVKDLSKLKGEIVGSGAKDIIADTKDILTFKCSSCGAEVVIDTASSTSARCHWCRNTLSVNQQIPNGAVPDTVLPFSVSKDEAKKSIEEFVGKRRFFAHPQFRKEFTTDNVMGVYLPYMIIDANTHARLIGQGEHETRRYTVKRGDNSKTYYDADLYDVEREFDLTVEGLTVESSLDKLDTKSQSKTTNIINSIMPFDTENCVKWDSNYLVGYTSEKRDTNINQLKGLVKAQTQDIARFAANDTLEKYDRGVRWDSEELNVKGQRWKSAYLPVWLYSYQQKNGTKEGLLHYVAVNARTKETMGSVPIHKPKLILFSILVEILGMIATFVTLFIREQREDEYWPWLFLLAGFIYYLVIYAKYRNQGARHGHEKETKHNMTNLRTVDTFVKKEHGLSNSRMTGANNTSVSGLSGNKKFMEELTEEAERRIEENKNKNI